ncbi:hypothetical protein B0J11DRAFT_617967 [Dendryphion nanum]|uniref:Uncharacterized protein n=1 Tax=Dendryphion nanum TaxID=256645 RepID=A0A9P9DDB8_9PLEO|nr:hypothetical protein B0J11DRAFT_617967 [Dendryphion nanum]
MAPSDPSPNRRRQFRLRPVLTAYAIPALTTTLAGPLVSLFDVGPLGPVLIHTLRTGARLRLRRLNIQNFIDLIRRLGLDGFTGQLLALIGFMSLGLIFGPAGSTLQFHLANQFLHVGGFARPLMGLAVSVLTHGIGFTTSMFTDPNNMSSLAHLSPFAVSTTATAFSILSSNAHKLRLSSLHALYFESQSWAAFHALHAVLFSRSFQEMAFWGFRMARNGKESVRRFMKDVKKVGRMVGDWEVIGEECLMKGQELVAGMLAEGVQAYEREAGRLKGKIRRARMKVRGGGKMVFDTVWLCGMVVRMFVGGRTSRMSASTERRERARRREKCEEWEVEELDEWQTVENCMREKRWEMVEIEEVEEVENDDVPETMLIEWDMIELEDEVRSHLKVAKSIRLTKDIKPTREINLTKEIEPTMNVKPFKHIEHTRDMKPTRGIKPATGIQIPGDTKVTRDSNPTTEAEFIKPIKPIRDIGDIKVIGDIKPIQSIKDTKFIRDIIPTRVTAVTAVTKAIEPTNAKKETSPTTTNPPQDRHDDQHRQEKKALKSTNAAPNSRNHQLREEKTSHNPNSILPSEHKAKIQPPSLPKPKPKQSQVQNLDHHNWEIIRGDDYENSMRVPGAWIEDDFEDEDGFAMLVRRAIR